MPRFTELSPLFHLLDDCETHRSRRPTATRCTSSTSTASFTYTPAFDVRELSDSYHLDGELPGVHQSNIEIKFSDPQTLVIKGRTEREYMNENIEGSRASERRASYSSSSSSSPTRWRQPTVEDENENNENAESSSETDTTDNNTTKKTSQSQPQKSAHYWISERVVGNFQRTFTFSTRVDQDAVRANLKNGILSVVVPKEAAPRTKKIRVE